MAGKNSHKEKCDWQLYSLQVTATLKKIERDAKIEDIYTLLMKKNGKR